MDRLCKLIGQAGARPAGYGIYGITTIVPQFVRDVSITVLSS
jgi:hypothetical protein